MVAAAINFGTRRETLLSRLNDAAFETAARHGVNGSSVDLELDLWRTLGRLVPGEAPEARRLAENRSQDSRKNFLDEVTTAAYGVILQHGFRGSFLEMELDLWKSLCRVLR